MVVSKLHLDESPEHSTMKWLNTMDVIAAIAPEIMVFIQAKPITAPSPYKEYKGNNIRDRSLFRTGRGGGYWVIAAQYNEMIEHH